MPFKIMRNDITKVKADILVNTANPYPKYATGTDYAIYHAAGKDKLLEARKEIGEIELGDIAVTDAFNLDAKYIIHAVGPRWIDGKHDEIKYLDMCYDKALKKAIELKCESIAFPLLSTGVFEFPKDLALKVALDVFNRYLLNYDIDIILVVFDMESFQLSSKIIDHVRSYIDTNYVHEKHIEEYAMASNHYLSRVQCMAAPSTVEELDEDWLKVGMSFQDKLRELILHSGMEDKDVWRRANIDRRLFSKIFCTEDYHPSKKTVLALCIGLQLDLETAQDLLARADYAFSPSSKRDLIIKKQILDHHYDMIEINTLLFKYTEDSL